MSYGIVISEDSFVFTRTGVVTVRTLQADTEVLGVSGVHNFAELQKVELRPDESVLQKHATRLVTQVTDSILLPDTLFCSETIQNSSQILSKSEVEFFHAPEAPKFAPGSGCGNLTLEPEEAYAVGLMTKPLHLESECAVFLLRNAGTKDFQKSIYQSITEVLSNRKLKVDVRIRNGQLDYAWIVLMGSEVNEVRTLLSSVSPADACLKLRHEALVNYVAGMLDARIGAPLYGGNPVVLFSKDESIQKRFLNSVLLLFESRVAETSCITSHSPKVLETADVLSNTLPVRNPEWENVDNSKTLNLFSKVRGIIDVQTRCVRMVFDEQGFSPIVDCLYTYPCVLKE
jgi:hypothetical protein